ncbi:MAG: hypothetical protein WCJ35_06515 [Planctomycetota bacterium]
MAKLQNMPEAIKSLLMAVDHQINAAAEAKDAVEALRRLAADDVGHNQERAAKILNSNLRQWERRPATAGGAP